MDLTPFDDLDRRQASIIMADVAVAVEQDHQLQGRQFKITPFGDRVAEARNLRNKTALRYGKSVGNRIRRGVELRPTEGYIYGGDVAKVVAYCLEQEGAYAWPNLKTLLARLGEPWSALLALAPLDKEDRADEHVRRAVAGLDDSATLARDLRQVASRVAPLTDQLDALSRRLTEQSAALTNIATANERMKKTVREAIGELERLRRGADGEKDVAKKAYAVETYTLLVGRLNKLLE